MRRVEVFDEIDSPLVPAGPVRRWLAGLPPEARQRLVAITLAVGLEVLLILALLSLGEVKRQVAAMSDALITFDVASPADPAPQPPAAQPTEQVRPSPLQPAAPPPRPAAENVPQRTAMPVPMPPRPAAILRSDFDLGAVPGESAAQSNAKPQPVGPSYTPSPGDTPRIAGSGPNGEPLYAARWYRRPYEDELAGYLSTVQGPGWGQVDCRTVRDWRVEDCVVVGESPQGSGIGKAVQAAAWQFKVRPPLKGGRSMVGEWVRIRIYYEIAPSAATGFRLRE